MTQRPGRHRPEPEQSERADEVDDAAQPGSGDQASETAETPAELDRIHRERADIGRPPPRWKVLLLTPSNGVWAGLIVLGAGLSAIFYSWGAVAGSLEVDRQIASLTSSGFVGLALVVFGIAAVDIAVRLQDRPERTQQIAQVERSVAELRDLRAGRARAS